MPNVAHYSINADDLKRAQKFYQGAFNWKFEPWGPPGFYMINTGDESSPRILGSLQGRRELVPGQKMTGYECTISVPSITKTIAAIKEHGGMAMAQTLESAKYDAILRSAIATGLVDHVLPVEEMPAKLMEYAAHLSLLDGKPNRIREQIATNRSKIHGLLRPCMIS